MFCFIVLVCSKCLLEFWPLVLVISTACSIRSVAPISLMKSELHFGRFASFIILNFLWDQGTHMFFFVLYNPSWHYMFKVNNRNARASYGICSKYEERPKSNIIDVVLEPCFLTTLNMFWTLFYCFNCWLWACNAGRNCRRFLYCCQIKLLEQIKL